MFHILRLACALSGLSALALAGDVVLRFLSQGKLGSGLLIGLGELALAVLLALAAHRLWAATVERYHVCPDCGAEFGGRPRDRAGYEEHYRRAHLGGDERASVKEWVARYRRRDRQRPEPRSGPGTRRDRDLD